MYSDMRDHVKAESNEWYRHREIVLDEVIVAVNKDIPNQPDDHLEPLKKHNEDQWMRKLWEVRKRRFDELVEFDKRILEEDKKWYYYDRNKDDWKSNVVEKAALLAAGVGAASAMDAMGEEE